MLNYYVHVILP